jgi:acetolactate synthase-1/2/3 large subunit
LNGAESLCAALEDVGIDCVFGVPGTQDVALYGALRRTRIRTVAPTHELAGAFMANGYFRASGRPAALFTIPGPGFAYALPGLAEARQDSAALLHIVGAAPHGQRRFQLQALDQRQLAAPLAKAIVRAETAEAMAPAVESAFDLAVSGEPGPVVLEYSARALSGDAGRRRPRGRRASPEVDLSGVAEIAAFVARARRPVIFAGQGCADASAPLRQLAERLTAPVLTTLSGRGALPEDHALALGFEFACGEVETLNALLRQADCVLAVGVKLSAAGTHDFGVDLPPDRLIHVDSAADVLGATYPPRLAMAAPAGPFLGALLAALSVKGAGVPLASAWTLGEVAGWRERLRARGADAGPEPRFREISGKTASAVVAALRRALPRDGILVTDSGLHQALVRRYFEVRAPRGLIVPSDFQSMGFGVPAAIGARLAAPDRPVVAVVGDGGFAMTAMELLTAVRERLAFTVVVFTDGHLGRIRLQQLARDGHATACDVHNPDLEALSRALGVEYARGEGDLEGTLCAAIGGGRPAVVEVAVSDSLAIHVMRVQGLARAVSRRTLPRRARQWLRRRARGGAGGE